MLPQCSTTARNEYSIQNMLTFDSDTSLQQVILLCCSPLITVQKLEPFAKVQVVICTQTRPQKWPLAGCTACMGWGHQQHVVPAGSHTNRAWICRHKLSKRECDGVSETINCPKLSAVSHLSLLGITRERSKRNVKAMQPQNFTFLLAHGTVSRSWESPTTVWSHFPQQT